MLLNLKFTVEEVNHLLRALSTYSAPRSVTNELINSITKQGNEQTAAAKAKEEGVAKEKEDAPKAKKVVAKKATK